MKRRRERLHPEVNELFGKPPVFSSESRWAYEELLARVTADVKPSGAIEEILVRDIVDLTWEIIRWRKLKVEIMPKHMATLDCEILYMRAGIEIIDAVERWTTVLEARRNAMIRELDRHRAAAAQSLKESLSRVDDAEFRIITTNTPQLKKATN